MTLDICYNGPSTSFLTELDMSHIQLCPAIAFNRIVGGRYKLHILCVLQQRPLRFGEIARSLKKGGLGKPITPRVLSRELKEMTDLELISRKDFQVVPRKVEYAIADRGRPLFPVLSEIIRWGATGQHEEILALKTIHASNKV